MRNLKRALSLALASVMLLGMMVVGTSAASYPDVDNNDNVEAIAVLQAVGVMVGDNRGNFNPDNAVTRNEMAAVMARLMLGTYEAESYTGVHPFTDVPAWADKYVAACYAAGIVNGTSATTFSGTRTVTAIEAAAMMVRALGYEHLDPKVRADGTKETWDMPIAAKANEINLFAGMNGSGTAKLDRNDVAKLSLNALETIMVETKQVSPEIKIGNTTINAVYEYDYRYDNNEWKYDGKNETYLQLCEYLYKGDLKKNTGAGDDFGRPATEWTYKNNSVIKASDAADATYTTEVEYKTIYKDLGLSGTVKTVTLCTDGGKNVDVASKLVKDGADKIGGNGILVQAYKVRDNEVKITLINTYLAQAIEDYDADKEQVQVELCGANKDTYKLDKDTFVITNVKEDDYMLVTIAGDEVKTVTPVEVLSDVAVTAARKDDYVTVSGKRYSYNGTAKADAAALGQDKMSDPDEYDLNGGSYNLYLDPYGYVIGVDEVKGEANVKDYLIVTADGATSAYDAVVKVMFTDGTKKTISVTEYTIGKDTYKVSDAKKIADYAANFKKGQIYTFKEKDGDYKLTLVPDKGSKVVTSPTNAAKDYSVSTGVEAKPAAVKGASYLGNSKTVFIADGKVSTGVKNAPEVKSGNVSYVLDKDSKLLIVWVDKEGTASSTDMVYILHKDAEVSGSNRDIFTYAAVVNGKKGEIKADKQGLETGLYEVESYDSDGRATLTAIADAKKNDKYMPGSIADKDSIYDIDGEWIAVNGKTYDLASDVKIISIDGKTVNENVRLGSLKSLYNNGFTNIILVREKDDEDAKVVAVYLLKVKK